MKNIKNIAWGTLVALVLGYCLFCLADCKDKPTVAPPVVVLDSPKPTVRVVPDSEYCKSIAPYFAQSRAVGVRGKYWANGQTLSVGFIGGAASRRKYVTDAFSEWGKTVNINFTYPEIGPYKIRVAFNSGDGSWSYIGTDCNNVAQNQPTMNIGWSGLDVCLHEIGHALGAAHEQASPNSDINWNKPVVYAALGGPPNNWPPETVDFNVFRKMTQAEADATTFDPTSIMQYSVPASWTYNYINGIPGGKVLSAQDIAFWSAKYPKSIPPPPPPVNVTITTAQRDNLRRIQNLSRLYSDSVTIYSKKIFGI